MRRSGSSDPLTTIALTLAVALTGPRPLRCLDPYVGVKLPLVPLLAAGLLVALAVAALAGRSFPARRAEVLRVMAGRRRGTTLPWRRAFCGVPFSYAGTDQGVR